MATTGLYQQQKTQQKSNIADIYSKTAGWCSTPTYLLICSSFNRENGYPLLICSSLSTGQTDSHTSFSQTKGGSPLFLPLTSLINPTFCGEAKPRGLARFAALSFLADLLMAHIPTRSCAVKPTSLLITAM